MAPLDDPQKLYKVVNLRTRDTLKQNIVKTGQVIEKRTGDLRRIDVTQISMKDHQLMLVEKHRCQSKH